MKTALDSQVANISYHTFIYALLITTCTNNMHITIFKFALDIFGP